MKNWFVLTAFFIFLTTTASPQAVHAMPTLVDDSAINEVGYPSVVRSAEDCNVWHYIPHRWRAVPSRQAAVMQWVQTGPRTLGEQEPRLIYTSAFVSDLLTSEETSELSRRINSSIQSKLQLERARLANGTLVPGETLYAGICDSVSEQTIRFVPLPLSELGDISLDDASKGKRLTVRFSPHDTRGFLMEISGSGNPLIDGTDIYAMLTTSQGLNELFPTIRTRAVQVAYDLSLSVLLEAQATFSSYVTSSTSCHRRCSRFLFWERCRTNCHTTQTTHTFLQSQQFRQQLTALSTYREDAASSADQAFNELLNRLIQNNVFTRFGEAAAGLTSSGHSAGTYSTVQGTVSSLREIRLIDFGMHPHIEITGDSEFQGIESLRAFLVSGTYRCAQDHLVRERLRDGRFPGYLRHSWHCPGYEGSIRF